MGHNASYLTASAFWIHDCAFGHPADDGSFKTFDFKIELSFARALKVVTPFVTPIGKFSGCFCPSQSRHILEIRPANIDLSTSVQIGKNEGKKPKLLANETLYQLS
jgi:hypothetical protein